MIYDRLLQAGMSVYSLYELVPLVINEEYRLMVCFAYMVSITLRMWFGCVFRIAFPRPHHRLILLLEAIKSWHRSAPRRGLCICEAGKRLDPHPLCRRHALHMLVGPRRRTRV